MEKEAVREMGKKIWQRLEETCSTVNYSLKNNEKPRLKMGFFNYSA